ncbi:MAG: 50S ribosomal protein L4 [Armatimonadota bacterium]|jgi:large subunit ribosomal protein L4
MPELALYNMEGQKVEQIALSDAVFGLPMNMGLLHQATVAEDTARRRFSARTKTRSEVRLTGGKLYRQKGLGMARHGSKRAPIFVGGSVAHGPRAGRRRKRLPKKMRRKALMAALSAKTADGDLTVVDEVALDDFSTKTIISMLDNLDAEGRVLLVLGDRDQKVVKSCGNVVALEVQIAPELTLREVLGCDCLIITRDAVQKLEEAWAPCGTSQSN